MNPNCPLCHGMGWYWAELTAYGKVGHFQRPCPECNADVYAVWMEAGKQGRFKVDSVASEAIEAVQVKESKKRDKPYIIDLSSMSDEAIEYLESVQARLQLMKQDLYNLREENKALQIKNPDAKIRYTQEWLGERLADIDSSIVPLPCDECGNDVIEFSKPADIANRVLNPTGDETKAKYLCMHCFLNALRQELGIPKRDDPFRGKGDE